MAAKARDVRFATRNGMGTGLCLMKWVDITSEPRVHDYSDLFQRVAQIDDPELLLKTVIEGMARIQGPRGYIRLATFELPRGCYRITRFTKDTGEELVTPDTWGLSSKMFPVRRGGFLGEIVRTPEPKLIEELYLRDDPVLGDQLAEYGSAMAVQLYTRIEPGDWLVILSRHRRTFDREDLPEAIMRGNLIGGVLENLTTLRRLREAQQRIQLEVDQIAEIERSMLFSSPLQVPGLAVAANYATFDRAGGDYFRTLRLTGSPEHWLILIADVAGHGAAAAVVVALLHALLDRLPENLREPGSILTYLNDYFHRIRLRYGVITAFCTVFTPETLELQYARAGHEYPLLKRFEPEAALKRLGPVDGFPLGIVGKPMFEEAAIRLRANDTLLFYTDGVTDARSPSGDLYGRDRLGDAFLNCSWEPVEAIRQLLAAIETFEGGGRPADDQTMVICRVTRD